VSVNPGLPWQKQHLSFRQQTGPKVKAETSEVLHLEDSFAQCWNLDTSESRSEVPGNF
jgi:hypothetical protein